MSVTRPGPGEALALTRTLAPADPYALFAALSDGGRRRDVVLIERAVGPSLLMDQAAVRVECRGQSVTLTALSEDGRNILDHLSHAGWEPERAGDRLTLTFPRIAGHDSEARLTALSPFDVLRRLSSGLTSLSPEEPFAITLPGIVAYDHVDLFEDLPAPSEDRLGFPDFIFWLAQSLIVFEPAARPRAVCTAFGASDAAAAERAYFGAADRLARLVARCAAAGEPEPLLLSEASPALAQPDLSDAAYERVVSEMKAHIAAGDVYQIVPSRTFAAPCRDPLRTFGAVRRRDPSPYQFFIAGPDHLVFGASPETSVRVYAEQGTRMVEVKPIAGTRARGATQDEDDRLEAEMRLDQKELSEHMMLVDLARNDVARVSRPGTRRVAKLMTVERYARVMHLVSSVTGALRPGLDALHALQACLNVGTLTGAPKIRATQLLREAERTKRGPYGGAVGWLTGEGLLDTGVVIRSAVVVDDTAYVRVGAGVVHDSDPAAEADETCRKASAMLTALAATGEMR